MLLAATAAIGAAVSAGSAIYGAIQSNKKNKVAQQLVSSARSENQRWYDSRMASDYTRRSDSQAVLEKQRKMYNDQLQQARATNAVAGGTNEAVAVQQKAAAEGVSNTMSNLAAAGAQYKDAVEQQYRATDMQLNQQQIGAKQQEANNVAQAAGQGVTAGMNLLGASMNAKYNKPVKTE